MGQLGTGTKDSSPIPVASMTGVRCIDISATAHATAAITESGSVLTWGDGAKLGFGAGATARLDPRELSLPGKVTHVMPFGAIGFAVLSASSTSQ